MGVGHIEWIIKGLLESLIAKVDFITAAGKKQKGEKRERKRERESDRDALYLAYLLPWYRPL